MYSLSIPVAQLRTKMRQEFERHRYVNQMGVVDTLLFQSHAEFQVSRLFGGVGAFWGGLVDAHCSCFQCPIFRKEDATRREG